METLNSSNQLIQRTFGRKTFTLFLEVLWAEPRLK
jgi:hypothetical protein